MLRLVQLTAWILTTAYASPFPAPTDVHGNREVNCKAVNTALSVLKILGPAATTFCSSYLHIPSATSTTITGPTATVTVTTSTATITTGQCAVAGKRDVVLERLGNALIAQGLGPLKKRVNIPALSAFEASKLSSGCSCISLAPKTTATATITPPTHMVNVVATTTTYVTCGQPGAHCDINNFITQCFHAPDGIVRCLFPNRDLQNGQCSI